MVCKKKLALPSIVHALQKIYGWGGRGCFLQTLKAATLKWKIANWSVQKTVTWIKTAACHSTRIGNKNHSYAKLYKRKKNNICLVFSLQLFRGGKTAYGSKDTHMLKFFLPDTQEGH